MVPSPIIACPVAVLQRSNPARVVKRSCDGAEDVAVELELQQGVLRGVILRGAEHLFDEASFRRGPGGICQLPPFLDKGL
eukprot:451333-Alexandrium_andersonii.AAC.1